MAGIHCMVAGNIEPPVFEEPQGAAGRPHLHGNPQSISRQRGRQPTRQKTRKKSPGTQGMSRTGTPKTASRPSPQQHRQRHASHSRGRTTGCPSHTRGGLSPRNQQRLAPQKGRRGNGRRKNNNPGRFHSDWPRNLAGFIEENATLNIAALWKKLAPCTAPDPQRTRNAAHCLEKTGEGPSRRQTLEQKEPGKPAKKQLPADKGRQLCPRRKRHGNGAARHQERKLLLLPRSTQGNSKPRGRKVPKPHPLPTPHRKKEGRRGCPGTPPGQHPPLHAHHPRGNSPPPHDTTLFAQIVSGNRNSPKWAAAAKDAVEKTFGTVEGMPQTLQLFSERFATGEKDCYEVACNAAHAAQWCLNTMNQTSYQLAMNLWAQFGAVGKSKGRELMQALIERCKTIRQQPTQQTAKKVPSTSARPCSGQQNRHRLKNSAQTRFLLFFFSLFYH